MDWQSKGGGACSSNSSTKEGGKTPRAHGVAKGSPKVARGKTFLFMHWLQW